MSSHHTITKSQLIRNRAYDKVIPTAAIGLSNREAVYAYATAEFGWLNYKLGSTCLGTLLSTPLFLGLVAIPAR